MSFTLYATLLFLTLAGTVTQTHAQLEDMNAEQGGIFDVSELAVVKGGKSTKAPSPLPTLAPTGPTPAPTLKLKKKKKSKTGKSTKGPTPAPTTAQVKGFLITGVDPSFEIVSCGPEFVEVKGSGTADISPGNILIYVRSDMPVCSSCNPLYRKVQSISASLSGTLLLETTLITVSEMVQVATTPEAIAFGILPIEPLFSCPSGDSAGQDSVEVTPSDIIEGGTVVLDNPPSPWLLSPDDYAMSISAIGSCNDNWHKKNSDGRCSFTNCYVGVNGDPMNCFGCLNPTTCDNGCGPQGSVFNTDGNFGTFDFGPACCNHDFCYSSNTFSKDACDVAFYDTMKRQCPPLSLSVFTSVLFPVLSPILLGCDALASAFYLAVSFGGDKAHADAQAEQNLHEEDPVCIAQCPSTQRSGGQGLTVLKIDMLRPDRKSVV